MSGTGTRRVAEGAQKKDERFASSPLLCQGLKAGDVVRRCETLANPAHIELALFIQHVSCTPGGLEKLTADLLSTFPQRLGSPSMHRLGIKIGGKFGADAVQAIRADLAFQSAQILLRGEVEESLDDYCDYSAERERNKAQRHARSGSHPTSYPVAFFVDRCRARFIETASEMLRDFCLDPAVSFEQLDHPSFHSLGSALIEYMDIWERRCLEKLVVTELGAKVLEALGYSESQRCLALVEGFARTGKTFVARLWCEARPGRRRFLSLTEATSDKEFFREIAKALGAASSYGFKGNELRERVNDILRPGHLTFVIDEAHFLWPTRNLREATPRRIEWVRTSLANYDVPVTMIATHQFTKAQKVIEKNTSWSSEQLVGRIAFCAKLPDVLEDNDIEKVARSHLPEADVRSIKFLVNYVVASKKYLASIDHGVKAARHQAAKQGRTRVTYQDIILGFSNTILPSDTALAGADEKTSAKPSASRMQPPSKAVSNSFACSSSRLSGEVGAGRMPVEDSSLSSV